MLWYRSEINSIETKVLCPITFTEIKRRGWGTKRWSRWKMFSGCLCIIKFNLCMSEKKFCDVSWTMLFMQLLWTFRLETNVPHITVVGKLVWSIKHQSKLTSPLYCTMVNNLFNTLEKLASFLGTAENKLN